MIAKEKYVLRHIKGYAKTKAKKDKQIDPNILTDLIEQLEFDYEMEKEYRPEVLEE